MTFYPPPPQPPPTYARQPHPRATLVLVFGILGLAGFGVLAPVAWVLGNQALAEVERSGGYYHDEGLRVGRLLGIIGTALLGLSLLFFVVVMLAFGSLALAVMSGAGFPAIAALAAG